MPLMKISNQNSVATFDKLPCNVMLFLSSEMDRSLLFICNALASSLAPMSPIKLPLISGKYHNSAN